MTLSDIRYYAEDFMIFWALAHQDHPIYSGGPPSGLWEWALAKRRAALLLALALYRGKMARKEAVYDCERN